MQIGQESIRNYLNIIDPAFLGMRKETIPIPVFLIFLFGAKGHNLDAQVRCLNYTLSIPANCHLETLAFCFCLIYHWAKKS